MIKLYSKYNSELYHLCNANFSNWWNPKNFNWQKNSLLLAKYCPDKFNIWWDWEKFNYKDGLHILIDKYQDRFELWWKPERINFKSKYNQKIIITGLSDKYSYWRKYIKVTRDNINLFANYCKEHISDWWDSNKYDWRKYVGYLIYYCLDYINVWWDLEKIVKYVKNEDIERLIELNNEMGVLPEKEIVKLKLLKGV